MTANTSCKIPRIVLATLSSLALSACVSNEPRPDPAPAPTTQAPAQPVAEVLPECKPAPAKTTKSKTNTAKNKKAPPASEASTPCREPEKTAVKETPPAAAPAPTTAAATATHGGYDLSKNKPVTDSTQVRSGDGTTVKGINDWQGEITGIPAANSRFTKLQIGMPLQQVIDLIGQPTDQGAYVTGKAFIPFYFGSDRTRWEAAYKGQGRLIFASQAGFTSSQYLVWVIHNSKDPGYR